MEGLLKLKVSETGDGASSALSFERWYVLNMGDRESRMWTVSCSRSGIDGDMYEGKALRNKLNVYEVSSALKLSNLQSGVAAHPEDLVEDTQMLPALGHIGNYIPAHDLLER